jgi:hypothetical protein
MSKIEVNEIDAQSGSTITVGSACKSVAVPGNVVKTNAVQASDAGNIISQSGTTITLGASGDTVSLASGASQTGFGRTGTVDWQTGSIKTATFTAASGEGYFCNTSGGAFTVNLPAGSAGAIVAVSDYTRTFQTNNLTVSPNGSEKIGGVAANATLSTEGQSATFVYVDGTEGWINVQETSNSVSGRSFITATGGNSVATVGNCKIHTFTGPGTFCVSAISSEAPENVVSYLVIAGGGSASCGGRGGGGGAGGLREVKTPLTPYTASPLDGYPTSPNRVTITATGFPITVGAGGNSATGGNSIFSTITSAGGGRGGTYINGPGGNGGSGGGGSTPGAAGGTGNTPPVSPAQGTNGAAGGPSRGGGGGGAGGAGGTGPSSADNGGASVTSSITNASVVYGAGGRGSETSDPANDGATNTGAGGCRSNPGTVGKGGSGIVVIRYKFQ